MKEKSIYEHLKEKGLSRRDFIKLCGTIAGMMGLEFAPPVKALGKMVHPDPTEMVAKALSSQPKLPIVWLEFQDCAGCSEAMSRSSSPLLSKLVLNDLAIEYHETLMASAGYQAEKAKEECLKDYYGRYVLVVEGSPTLAEDGIYCTVAGKSNLDLLREAADGAAAIIATGNCASFGGIPKAKPNPTRACGVGEIIKDKPVVNIPGCPAIPEVTTGTILHFLIMGKLPETDHLKRPLVFYGHTVHDHCLRRPFYEAGKFADNFDGDRARKGYCLYHLGCKGPITYNACASLKWERGLSYPVQSGHPCLGCSEPNFWDGGGFYQGQSAALIPPAAKTSALAAGAGLAAGSTLAGINSAKKNRAKKALASAAENSPTDSTTAAPPEKKEE
ncbi:MAG: hydrogenase small subunit [Acidobacteriota bacterium]|nr:hydrogenase small subunit [Acidobacteriota bacterium]MDW3229014.1 hydrogenase small subunit [Acidobacteriota bacterium]